MSLVDDTMSSYLLIALSVEDREDLPPDVAVSFGSGTTPQVR
jgi:hypothetical protein